MKIFAEKFGGFGKKPYLCGVYFVEPLKYEKQNEEEGNPDKVKRGREGRKTADLNDINMINKDLFRKKKCC